MQISLGVGILTEDDLQLTLIIFFIVFLCAGKTKMPEPPVNQHVLESVL